MLTSDNKYYVRLQKRKKCNLAFIYFFVQSVTLHLKLINQTKHLAFVNEDYFIRRETPGQCNLTVTVYKQKVIN